MLKQALLASTALLFCASAQAQTFNSIAPADWPRGQPWAPTFQASASDSMACAWSGTNPVPSDANPISFSSGGIQLAVFRTPPDYTATGRPFICGEVTTRTTFSQLYGYFQATIKMPSTPGTMGAFWLNAADGSWPPEIDVIEALAKDPTMLTNTAHSVDAGDSNNQTDTAVANMTTSFHTYAVDWEAKTITWYFDGQQTKQIATPSDMHKPMYMLLDTAVGTCAAWEGCPQSSDILDAMTVASVEVWTSNPHLPPPTVVAQASPVGAPAASPGQSDAVTRQAAEAAAIAAAAAEPTPEQAAADQAMQATQQRLDAYDEQISTVNDRIKALQARIAAGAGE